ncbi:flagellar biosynthesis protein FlhA [[Clostridium] sordellii]|uniref:Flagellar biosynthesis protein FlhA n=1 Tax=Paraclostridium sordellii TaxID=1505 RepID=A0A9P1P7U2_PARSO|nr:MULTISPECIES: flagellar biosynthesis protein FlhA [Paeniclostridium]AUN15165.1 flagellar biosynthesis protein FlhA [Paeniclostridium sordellii]EPZ59822.1 flagellar biosynthesis protein FlhA [[Clostridium] sordellii VPI 9048] [Paeniclostridium sordellii VPI 9048]MBS6023868.1 flagellar biosynthesis protein FlhA [Paeniclostridium sordellii]MBW4861342.1 flagellar biosynthesis protein FlhA [Paeniclostridium sp.]MBW4874573.1 flagellar biosynthesis protein FlhA [Paeniclostridium sp.]
MEKFSLKKRTDILVGFGIIGIILMIIIPLPPFLLDIMLALNIGFSILILLMTIFSTSILELSIFPTILLVTTLFRLGLNISSTRLILGQGYAGSVIESFGSFVVGGNYVVGIIIFLIIIIIQFVVITNGSGRVSEVSARFTLDALPGKQMSIDADLNAGMIDEKTARKRRTELQQEAEFYGSMDGASKFVKGDAIAGIIITTINILAGMVIGVVMLNMDFMESIQTYTRLTIGDGLVSQIPALIISTSAGILVTKVNGEENFSSQLGKQLMSIPQAVLMAGIVLVLLGLLPGLPKLSFFTLGAGAIFVGYTLKKEEKSEQENALLEIEEPPTPEESLENAEDVSTLINVEPIEVEIGYGIIPLADESSGGDLLQRIVSVRRQCAIDMGIIVHPIRIRDNLQLEPNQYTIKIKGVPVTTYELMPNMLLCMNPMGMDIDMEGISTKEPTFGLDALWIEKDKAEEAELYGFTVVDPTTILVTHLLETIKAKSYELMGRQEVKAIIDATRERYSAVVDELIPDLMTLGEVQKIFQNLLKEKVSIKDRVTILETLADNARNTKDLELLTEYVRMAMSRSICFELIDENNSIVVTTLSMEIENLVANSLQRSVNGTYPAIDPDTTNNIFRGIQNTIESVNFNNNRPILLVSPKIRAPFRKLVEMVFPNLTILSLNEIPSDVQIKSQGVVNI